MQRHLQRRPEGSEEAGAPRRAPAPVPAVLQLQQGAGNAAVTRMLQRQAAPAAPAPAPAAAATPPAKQTPEELLEEVRKSVAAYEGAAAKLKGVKKPPKADKEAAATTKSAHETAVLKLTAALREELPPKFAIDAYLDRQDVPQNEKVQTIGQLAAEVARMEFLLGTLHNLGTKAKWEKNNKGAFTDDYQKAMGGSATAPWCTKFAGYAYDRLGFKAGKEDDTSMFHSGYRLRTWANKGTDVSEKKQLTEKDKTVASGAGGATIVDNKAWAKLKKDLGALKKAKKKKPAAGEKEKTARDVVEEFFQTNARPQAGDIIVKPRGDQSDNAFTGGGSSHTMMVDKFDETNFVIYTVEGNTGDKVGSHRLDLTDEKTVGGIIFLTRLGTENFGEPGHNPAAEFMPFGFGKVVYSRETIVGTMQRVNAQLVELNAAHGFIKSDDADATVYEWIHGDTDAKAGGDTET